MKASKKFRELLKEKRNILLVGATLPIEALILQNIGFEAVYVSGAALSNKNGILDEGKLSRTEILGEVKKMLRVADIPLVVDCDTGYGEIARTVRIFERAGVAAIQIEDQVPSKKRCGHLDGKEIVPVEEMFWKINSAIFQKEDPSFMIIVRTDARSVEGLDAAIGRADRYVKAGADAIFPEALESLEEFKEFRRRVPKIPLVANLAECGKTPSLIASQLFKIGYQMVLIPATPFRMTLRTFRDAVQEIKILGHLNFAVENDKLIPRNELNDFIRSNSKVCLSVRRASKK